MYWGRAPLRNNLLRPAFRARRNALQRLERQLEARLDVVGEQLTALDRARLAGGSELEQRRGPYSTVGSFRTAGRPQSELGEDDEVDEAEEDTEDTGEREKRSEGGERDARAARRPARAEQSSQSRTSRQSGGSRSRSSR
jgi:hypothetical protein